MPTPSDFTFTLVQGGSFGDDAIYALIMPKGSNDPEDSKQSVLTVKQACPGLKYVDDCMMGYWEFPKELDTPEKMVLSLVHYGFEWDREEQDKSVIDPEEAKYMGTYIAGTFNGQAVFAGPGEELPEGSRFDAFVIDEDTGDKFEAIVNAKTEDFLELMEIGGMAPEDFIGIDVKGDLALSDDEIKEIKKAGFELTGTLVTGFKAPEKTSLAPKPPTP